MTSSSLFRMGSLLLTAVGVAAVLHAAPVQAAPPEAAPTQGPRPADDFRRGDPRETDLGPVAESSGLSHETAVQPRGHILHLDEVIATLTAEGIEPRLEAAERARDIALAKLMSARGAFDTKATIRGEVQPLGYYTHGVVDAKIEQPTPLWGLSLWTGWRLGLGDFAVYDQKRLTAAGGEVRTGISLPLAQGGAIDGRRAKLRQAKIEVERKTAQRDAKTLELEAKAAEAYWKWVAAGLSLEVERTLLEIAFERDAGLERQIELGNLESIIGDDNHRLILDREGRVVAAEREFQAATLELSLFWRDEGGRPLLAGADRLPDGFPTVTPPHTIDIDAEVEGAITRRPDLQA
ncbi:MAG: TolC family protein, partial [Myxococcales bacterium]|nr:TolC family protein [Myxococcales bacterium]